MLNSVSMAKRDAYAIGKQLTRASRLSIKPEEATTAAYKRCGVASDNETITDYNVLELKFNKSDKEGSV